MHSFSWAPLLFDFGAVPKHDTSTFDQWTFDGDYVHRNLGNIKRVHLVLDSDEIFLASWGPSSDRPHDLSPVPQLTRPLLGGYYKRRTFRAWFFGGVFDPFKQQIFFSAACWHAKPLTKKWRAVERRAARAMRSCVEPPKQDIVQLQRTNSLAFHSSLGRAQIAFDRSIHVVLTYIVGPTAGFILGVSAAAHDVWVHREAVMPRIWQLREGNTEVVHWVKWRIREIGYKLIGRVPEGKPERPSRPGIGLSSRRIQADADISGPSPWGGGGRGGSYWPRKVRQGASRISMT